MGELKELGASLANRIVCSWGDYSSIRVTLNCLTKLRETGTSWDFVNQLSGQDYPIRPLSELDSLLSADRNRCLMWARPFPVACWQKHGYDRLPTRFRFFRRFPLLGHKPWGGSAWWCLPADAINLIDRLLRSDKRYAEYWMRTAIPDELVFQTILGNSRHDISTADHLHYTKWDGGLHPGILEPLDLAHMRASGRLFARKFDEELNPGMLDRIDAELLVR